MTMAATVAYLTTVIALLITAVASVTPNATTYTNHTVGGAAGWEFDDRTSAPATNYTAWAANQTFNLGDYLIFNTNTNLTVIQTYNLSTYQSCSADNASDTDTSVWTGPGGGSNQFGVVETIAVPLTIEGTNYYFSDTESGLQCQKGMAFAIQVNRGLGLPPYLNQPPPPPYVEPPPDSVVQPPPVMVVPNDPHGGGSKASANLRWLVSALFFGGCLILGST